MASIIITGETCRNIPEIKKMLDDFLCGKIRFNKFIDFIEKNGLEIKTSVISDDGKRTDDKDILEKRAERLYRDICDIGKDYRKRSFNDKDSIFRIDSFTPENIIKFISILGLPTEKISKSLEAAKSEYYQKRIYHTFYEFEKCMKNAYNIDDVWEADLDKCPDWFKDIRDSLYSREHPEDDEYIELESDEWEDFQRWRKERNKENVDEYADKLFREIMNLKQKPSLPEMIGINDLALTKNIEGLEECVKCLKKSKNASLLNIILKYSCKDAPKKEDDNDKKTGDKTKSSKEKDSVDRSEIEARKLFNKIIDDFNPVFTGNALQYFENNFGAHKHDFIDRLQMLYDGIKGCKGRCGVDVDSHEAIIYNPISISVVN